MTDALSASILQDLTSFGWLLLDFLAFFPVYWIVPHFIAKRRKKPIATWRYVLRCYLINFFIGYYIIERVVYIILTDQDIAPQSYFALWTLVFVVLGVKELKRRNMLKTKSAAERRLGEDDGGDGDGV